MAARRRELVVVRLIEPELCLSCRFRMLAEVQFEDETVQTMTRCTRLDCDNWDRSQVQRSAKIELLDLRP